MGDKKMTDYYNRVEAMHKMVNAIIQDAAVAGISIDKLIIYTDIHTCVGRRAVLRYISALKEFGHVQEMDGKLFWTDRKE